MASQSPSKKMKRTEVEQKDVSAVASDYLVLDVGGAKYLTPADAVRDLNPCDDQLNVKEGEGKIFIDKDGILLRYILKYLRQERLVLPSGSTEIKAQDVETSLGLKKLQEEIEEHKKKQQDVLWIAVSSTQSPFDESNNAVPPGKVTSLPHIIQIACTVRAYSRFKSLLEKFHAEGTYFDGNLSGGSRKTWLDYGDKRENEVLTCFLRTQDAGFAFFEELSKNGLVQKLAVGNFLGYTY